MEKSKLINNVRVKRQLMFLLAIMLLLLQITPTIVSADVEKVNLESSTLGGTSFKHGLGDKIPEFKSKIDAENLDKKIKDLTEVIESESKIIDNMRSKVRDTSDSDSLTSAESPLLNHLLAIELARIEGQYLAELARGKIKTKNEKGIENTINLPNPIEYYELDNTIKAFKVAENRAKTEYETTYNLIVENYKKNKTIPGDFNVGMHDPSTTPLYRHNKKLADNATMLADNTENFRNFLQETISIVNQTGGGSQQGQLTDMSDSGDQQAETTKKEYSQSNPPPVPKWDAEKPTSDKVEREIEIEATAYTDDPAENGGYTTDRYGRPLKKGMIATDPDVIPMGTIMYVPGYGYGVATDTGGAIKGNRIDVCVGSSKEAASTFGRQKGLKIQIIKSGIMPTGGDGSNVKSTTSETSEWLKKESGWLKERRDLFSNLASMYRWAGNEDVSKEMDKVVQDLNDKMDELLNENGQNESFSEEGVNGSVNFLSAISDLMDMDEMRFNDIYLGLFAHTANYTPFVTNIYDANIQYSLTDAERDAFKKYGDKRSMVYSVVGDKGMALGVKDGTPYQYKPMSLAEFLDRVEEKETLLYIKAVIPKIEKDAKTETSTQASKATSITQAGTGNASEVTGSTEQSAVSTESTTGTTQGTTASTTENSSVQEQNTSSEEEKNLAAANATSSVGDIPWQVVNGSVADSDDIVQSDQSIVFVGPVYASSGEDPKDIVELREYGSVNVEDMFSLDGERSSGLDKRLNKKIGLDERPKEEEVRKAEKQIIEGKKETSGQGGINNLMGNTLNMNYVLMYNNLKNQKHLSPALEEDMNKPLYLDFVGNILTQSGFVVVPAAANYDYYNFTDELPMFNASFLNSYPDVRFDENQSYSTTSRLEREKFFYQKSRDGYVNITKLNSGGNASDIQFASLPLLSRGMFTGMHSEVNFMDDILMFKRNVKGFAESRDRKDDSYDLTFVNTGVIMEANDSARTNVVNLKNISNDGRSLDWALIKNINKNNIDVTKNKRLNQQLLATTAVFTVTSKDGNVTKTITDYMSKTEQLRSKSGFIKIVGELYEGFQNRVFSVMKTNYLLYTPTPDNMPLLPNMAKNEFRIITLLVIIMFIFYVIRFGIGIITRNDYDLKGLILTLVMLILIGSISNFLVTPIINLMYNKPASFLLKDDIPMYIIESIENGYRSQNNSFFDPNSKVEDTNDLTITLEKLDNAEVKYLREEMSGNSFPLPRFYNALYDNTRMNILGNKLFLQTNEVKLRMKDLMDISKIEDQIAADNNVRLNHIYTGYGELAYYMPYFHITDGLVERINSFNTSAKSPYRLIQYRRGLTKSTGRFEDYVKSIGFVAPEMLERYMEDLFGEYKYNEDTLDAYYNHITKPKNLDNEYTAEEFEEIASDEDLEEKEGKIFNVDAVSDDDVEKKIEENEKFKKMDKYKDVVVLNDAVDYLRGQSPEQLHDWLGLRKVLLLEETSMYPPEYKDKLKNIKWYPKKGTNMTEEDYIRSVNKRIAQVNKNTRNFVLNKVMPISGRISDDTAIKVTAMYATMEYNKEFETIVGEKLYPNHYNNDGLSNSFTTKAVFVPQDDIFTGGVGRVSEYLARNTSWIGLALALIDRFMFFIRMMIRVGLVSIVIFTLPFAALYIYVMRRGKYSRYVFGAISAIFVMSMMYIVEILWYKIAFNLTNNMGTIYTLSIGLIPQILLTTIYIRYLLTIVGDISNFGFGRLQGTFNRVMFGYTEEDMAAAVADTMDYDFGGYNNYSSLGGGPYGTGGYPTGGMGPYGGSGPGGGYSGGGMSGGMVETMDTFSTDTSLLGFDDSYVIGDDMTYSSGVQGTGYEGYGISGVGTGGYSSGLGVSAGVAGAAAAASVASDVFGDEIISTTVPSETSSGGETFSQGELEQLNDMLSAEAEGQEMVDTDTPYLEGILKAKGITVEKPEPDDVSDPFEARGAVTEIKEASIISSDAIKKKKDKEQSKQTEINTKQDREGPMSHDEYEQFRSIVQGPNPPHEAENKKGSIRSSDAGVARDTKVGDEVKDVKNLRGEDLDNLYGISQEIRLDNKEKDQEDDLRSILDNLDENISFD